MFRQSVSLEKEHEGKNQHVMCLTDRNGTYNHKINIRERGAQEQLIRNRWSKSLLTAATRRTADGFLQTHHGCVLCRVRVSFAGLRACGSPIFWPRKKQGYAQADSTFLHFLPFIFATKVHVCNLRVARPVSGQREHRSTGAQAEAER